MLTIERHIKPLKDSKQTLKTRFLKPILIYVSLILLSIIVNPLNASADQKIKQNKYKKEYRAANKLFQKRNYIEAEVIYKNLIAIFPKNSDLNFKLGTCYLKNTEKQDKSVKYLEKSIKYAKSKNDIPLNVYLNLAKSYHITYKFVKALKVFKNIHQLLSPENEEMKKKIERYIEISENGIELIKHPVKITVTNLGRTINSKYDDHSPGISADESTLIFTSRRKGTGGKLDADGQYFEDIYISYKTDNVWSSPKSIVELNTDDHDASISISSDGQKLYIYKAGDKNDKVMEGGDIMVSQLEGEKWSAPKKLGSNINSIYKEAHLCLSSNGQTLYFTSKRPDGFGKSDIYISHRLPNGKWGLVKNLGPNINTEYNEESPFIHPDGKTLYFSSNGHNTMGGLDIFKSELVNGEWAIPTNIGYPINSTSNDVYYTPSVDGKRAYFSSYRKGSLGKTDLFLLHNPDAEQKDLFVLKGMVKDSDGKAVGNSKLTVSLNGVLIGMYNSNSSSGKFLFIIKAGESYNVEVMAQGYRTLKMELNIPIEYANTENQSVITLLPVKLRKHSEPDYNRSINYIDKKENKIKAVILKTTFKKRLKKGKDLETIKQIKQQEKIPVQIGKYYTVQILALNFPIELSFFKNLDNVRMWIGKDNYTRYTYKRFDTYLQAKTEMNKLIKLGYWDSFIRTVEKDNILNFNIDLDNKESYTIQVMALKKAKTINYFKNLGLSNIKSHKGSDGLTRYTYKRYLNEHKAENNITPIVKKGYFDAFTRQTNWYRNN